MIHADLNLCLMKENTDEWRIPVPRSLSTVVSKPHVYSLIFIKVHMFTEMRESIDNGEWVV